MSWPRITVLTAVRNGALHLPQTIESVRAQTFTDWEYIIVDDASDDDTAEIVQQASRRDPRIRLLRRRTSGGPYVAANEGVRDAHGEYIARTDADDTSPPDRLRLQHDFLVTHPQFRACVGLWQMFDERGLIPGTVGSLPESPGAFCWYLLLRSAPIHSAAFLERSVFVDLGGYRELRLSQDYRLWCQLSRRGWLGVLPEVVSYVRVHRGRASLREGGLQHELALDVLSDHLIALTGARWPHSELEDLWKVGHSCCMPVATGLKMLDRWDALWAAAPNLNGTDRADLARLSAFRRWKHLRANLRRQPARVAVNLLRYGLTRPSFVFPKLHPVL